MQKKKRLLKRRSFAQKGPKEQVNLQTTLNRRLVVNCAVVNATGVDETNVSQRGTQLGPPRSVLLGNDDDDEGAGLHFAAAFAGGGRIEVGRGKKDVVSFQVEPHGACAALGGDVFYDGEFVRRIFVDDSEGAIAAGGEHVTGRGIEAGGVRAFADGRSGHDLSGIRVHHGHHFFIADGKEAAIGKLHGEAGRRCG